MTDQPTNQNRAPLYKKIAAVTAAVSRIPKNGHNKFFNYDYATESDITDALRELLNQNGLAFLPPSVISWERSETLKKNGERGDDLTRVQVQFALGCCETGETFMSLLWGEGQDAGDKGFYKAYTGAVKYYLMKTFLIATGDDPERDDGPPQRREAPQQQRSAVTAPIPRANGSSQGMRDKLTHLAQLRTEANKAKLAWRPAKPPTEMSALELDAAINQLEVLLAPADNNALYDEVDAT